ncbi:unnamed protein product [Clonostachys rosea f. rosea IK726]|uniref:FAD dependent oxidoreductase domain-containing protein n=2 Tax=Bionectria ochroleuca TaxID=29856 RepID=A0A0B7KI18_BIOOC|nr:unnamed protein product [Clonostachys rosea f. rosea IK726]
MHQSPPPIQGPTTDSFWRSSSHSLDGHRTSPDIPPEVEICVIGAGFAGASIVHHILDICNSQGQPRPRILILEARQACSGATGRNGGHIKPDPCHRPSSLAMAYGIKVAAECAAFEAQNLSAVKKFVEDEAIDCEFTLTRAVDAFMSDAVCDKVMASVDMLRRNHVPVMSDVHFAKGSDAEVLSGVKGVKGCISYSAGHLFPYKLTLHLLSKAVDAGINLQTHTPVLSVAEQPDADGFITVTTSRGSVKARNVVYATNAYTSSLLPEFAGKIIPVRGMCSHISPTKKPAPHLPSTYIIRWSDTNYDYLIPRLDGSIILGGARSIFYRDLDSWYNNVDDGQLIEAGKSHFDGYMQRVFHGWEDSGAYTSKLWTGIMGYSSDLMPFIGAVPGKKQQFIVAGFTGHGMPQIFLAAKGVASMIIDNVDFQSTGIPAVYQVTRYRLDSKQNSVIESWETEHGSAATFSKL